MVCDEGRASIVESAPYSSQIRGKFDMIVGNKEKNNMTSEYQKMIAGEFYRPSDPELRALAQASRQKQAAFNKEENPLKGAEIVCLNREKSLHQHSLDGGLRCQHPSRGKFLF